MKGSTDERNIIIFMIKIKFRKRKSCLENLARLTANYKNQGTLVAFLDVTAAYDNVRYSIMIKKLLDMKCPTRLVNAVSNWLYSREVKFITEDETIMERTFYKGLPQGAVLSPLLYNIYTCGIASSLPMEVSQVQFADIAIWNSNSNFSNRKDNIERLIEILYSELGKIGLDLQPSKTNLVDFGKAGLSNINAKIRCVNVNLSTKKEAKFLGIIFDCRLQFDSQCLYTKEKVMRANSIFRYTNKVSRGIEVNTSLLLYKSLIRSIIDYGCAIFVPNNNSVSRQQMEKAQLVEIRSVLGYRNSTPTNVILAEAKVTSIRERGKVLAKTLCIKIIAFGKENLKRNITESCEMEVRHIVSTRGEIIQY